MSNKRNLILAAVVIILAALVYVQFRTWQKFDWQTFTDVTGSLAHGRGLRHLLIAVALMYLTYWLRAVRWKIFLRPVRRASLRSLVPTQYIGFAGLALLGRPGELIRPYLIAKKENLTVSSQLAVWTVERIFDMGAFAVLMSIDVFFFARRAHLPHYAVLQKLGGGLLALVAVMAIVAWLIRRNGPMVASWVEARTSGIWPRGGLSLGHKIRAFGEGLNTIQDARSFWQLAGISAAIWLVIALAYRFVLHAYPQPQLRTMHIPHVLLLMACSMAGSMIQLPAIGGGSQLAVISMLSSPEWFAVPKELAVSAGILLWLVTFMTVVPPGLVLAHREHLSLRKLTSDTEGEPAAPAHARTGTH